MRTGSIFARGSCRALKWMALVGVVFALVAGQAAAQVKVTVPKTVPEGGRLRISVSADIRVPASGAADTMTIAASVDSQAAASTTPGVVNAAKMLTIAEPGDFTSAGSVVLGTPRNTNTEDYRETTVSGNIELQIQSDPDAEDEGIVVSLTLTAPTTTTVLNKGGAALALAVPTGGNGSRQSDGTVDANVTISDSDNQMFVWSNEKPATPNEGADIMVTLTAEPEPHQLSYATVLSVDQADYNVSPSSYTFRADDESTTEVDETMSEFIITPPNPDGDRDMDTIMVRVFAAGSSTPQAEPRVIEVADIHGLPDMDDISVTPYESDKDGKKDAKNEAMSVMEGAEHPVHVTVTADRGTTGYPAGEKLKVAVMGAAGQGRDYRVEPSTIEIASGMGKKSETFKLWALEDEDIGEENLMLQLKVTGADDKKGPGEVMVPFSIMITDATEPWVSVKDGAYDAIKMALGEDPLNPNDEVMIMTDDLFMYDDDMYNVSFAASVEGGAASASSSGESVTIMAMEPGEGKVTVTATASPMSSSLVITQDRANVAQVTFPVMVALSDLSVAVTADPMEIMEGGMSTITATASREVAAGDGEVKVDLEVIGGGTLSADSITIAAGSMSGTATVTAMEDDDYEDETLTVVASGAGSATLTIMVTDNDEMPDPTNLVTAKSSDEIEAVLVAAGLGDDDKVNPGATAMVDASMLFDAAEGVSVSYAAESDDMAAVTTSVSGSMVSVMAGETGHALIVITATATMASGIEIHTGQPATNVATVTFSVNIVPADLMLTLSGPEDMNVAEGMSAMVTVTANRAVTEDTTVMLMRDRAMSSASDDDYTAEAITIMAGKTMGTTMVMAVEDNMMEDMEELVLYAMAGDMEVEGHVKLYLWDAAVPALPVIAQLLLAFFLAIGGYRRYLRR